MQAKKKKRQRGSFTFFFLLKSCQLSVQLFFLFFFVLRCVEVNS